ncbi:hypothetical protein [Shewanella psychrotolerans]|uniref:hypothetical protein n=1 Tax=Shewanella psychrotolerans TaxID=2864206 RepID=UPI001C65F046|nr:hypothetical protein [Shewanella psychrotolerans]QYJ99758.1 hypothetical protein K0I62_09750 [Shewanella psychrotolerans]
MLKLASFALSAVITITYVIGFIYDASFLEAFHLSYYELLGSPLDYLTIGGMYLTSIAARNLVAVVILSLLSSLLAAAISNYSHLLIQMLPNRFNSTVVLLTLSPLGLILLMLVVHHSARANSENYKKDGNHIIQVEGADGQFVSHCGNLLRYRDNKTVFYLPSNDKTMVIPDKRVIQVFTRECSRQKEQ